MIAIIDFIALATAIIAFGLIVVKPQLISKSSYTLVICTLLITILVYGFSAFEWLRTYVADWPFARFDGTAALHNRMQDAQALCWLFLAYNLTYKKTKQIS